MNARWLPYVIAHGLLDELVPFASAAEQVLELDRLGYRHRFTVYPLEDHIAWVFQDKFEDPISHMGTGLRQADPGHITFAWYPQLVRADLGIGPHQVWWLSELTADPDGDGTARGNRRGRRAVVCPAGPDAHHSAPSRLHPALRPDARAVQRAVLASGAAGRRAAVSDAAAYRGRQPELWTSSGPGWPRCRRRPSRWPPTPPRRSSSARCLPRLRCNSTASPADRPLPFRRDATKSRWSRRSDSARRSVCAGLEPGEVVIGRGFVAGNQRVDGGQ